MSDYPNFLRQFPDNVACIAFVRGRDGRQGQFVLDHGTIEMNQSVEKFGKLLQISYERALRDAWD